MAEIAKKLDDISKRAKRISDDMGWRRDWLEAGCYLHLEASEYVEALRGKGDSPPASEAADVLFVLR